MKAQSRKWRVPGSPSMVAGCARGVALFLGGFALVNIVAHCFSSQLDGNLWWVDLRVLPQSIATTLLAATANLLVAFALWPRGAPLRRKLTLAALFVIGAVALENSVVFWLLLGRGEISTQTPVPFSLLVCGVSLWIASVVRKNPHPNFRHRFAMAGAFVFSCLAFPVLQVFCFGHTDYRRHADAAIVFGARTYADGRPSMALADRVRTACELYRGGLVSKLVFSGGPGDGAVHETEAMRALARTLGVPDNAIVVDRYGISTAATVGNTRPALWEAGAKRIIAVSEFYHLPRIKLTYQSAGWEVYTVPANPSHWARNWPLRSIAREVAAFWSYYIRALGGRLV